MLKRQKQTVSPCLSKLISLTLWIYNTLCWTAKWCAHVLLRELLWLTMRMIVTVTHIVQVLQRFALDRGASERNKVVWKSSWVDGDLNKDKSLLTTAKEVDLGAITNIRTAWATSIQSVRPFGAKMKKLRMQHQIGAVFHPLLSWVLCTMLLPILYTFCLLQLVSPRWGPYSTHLPVHCRKLLCNLRGFSSSSVQTVLFFPCFSLTPLQRP